VRLHLGKGSLKPATVAALDRYGSVFAVTPPVSALFGRRTVSSRVAAFAEEGMEALYEVEVAGLPAIVAIAQGRNIFERRGGGA
jgi:fumarate hydratase subunit beta